MILFLLISSAIDEEENESYRIEETRSCTEGHIEHLRTGECIRKWRVIMVQIENSRLPA